MALTQVSTGGIKDGQVQTADLADAQVTAGKLHADALDHTYTLGADGTNHYTFTGEGLTGAVNDPTLYLTRGKTYRFVNGNSAGAHPFRIQTTVNGSAGTEYNTGVTNNGGAGGSTIIFEVPHAAPDVLYYQCTSHGAMGGILYVTGALADGTVTGAKIASSAVSTAKLQTSAVDSTILAVNSVTTAKITDANVTTAKIADEAITLAKLEHGTSSNDGKFLRANNGGDPTFETIAQPDLSNLSASNLTSGTVPDARFPATLPAVSGANLTNIPVGGANNITFNSGNGIDFSATADGTGSSSISEIFDDYEEGTWTGAIETGSANINNEWYIKIGGYVVGGGSITAIGNTSSSNAMRVTGLPFSNSGGGSAPGAIAGSKISTMDNACMSTVSGSSIYFLTSSTSTGSWDYIKHQHVNQSSGSLTFSFHYYTLA